MQIGFLTAFLGGALALLSPCAALLLPAFFASTVNNRPRLVLHGGVFYIGLAMTLVPLGLGLGALGSLLTTQRGPIIALTALVLVGLGVAQLFGFGFDVARILPGAGRLRERGVRHAGLPRTLLLGAASGVAGTCAGPILGAILTLAIAHDPLTAGALLAVYGAGMVIPLVIIAAVWQRSGNRGRGLLQGRTFTVFGRRFHTTSVLTGTLIVTVGVVFWFTNGLVSMPSLVPTDVQAWSQRQSALLGDPLVDVAGIVILAALALSVWAFRRRRTGHDRPSTDLGIKATTVRRQGADP